MEKLSRIRLVVRGPAPSEAELAPLKAELPALRVEVEGACGICDAIIDCSAWATSPSFADFERAVRESSSDGISVRGACRNAVQTALEIGTRFQRLGARRNEASATAVFDAVLRARAGIGEHDAARDAWQWTLRLDANASLVAQLGALFVDLDDDVDAPLRAERVLDFAGVDDLTIARVMAVLERDAHAADAGAARLVDDAAALSFLALGSDRYADVHGAAEARFEVDTALRAMSRAAREKLASVRLRPDILHFVIDSAAA